MKRDEPSVVAKSMNHSLKALLSAAAAIALSLFANDSFAEISGKATMPNGAIVNFTSAAATNWVGGELVLKFTNVNQAASFSLPGQAKARILAVGGGGAGGTIPATGYTKAPGGGGGGGGFVERELTLQKDVYNITVGKGGARQTEQVAKKGEKGGDSSIIGLLGTEIAKAIGGGGGAAAADGEETDLDGGCGGGGASKEGGLGSQGGNGGTGKNANVSAGGGGAGADGGNVSSTTKATAGGDGKGCSIWNDTEIVYAGGGGGARRTTGTSGNGAGGAGGGGAGGLAAEEAEPGVDGLGGGGGGGSKVGVGGKGGDGVVIVRLSVVLPEPIAKPESQTLTYDGESHLLVAKTDGYGVWVGGSEVAKVEGTNAGTYPATVKLAGDFTWADGTKGDVSVSLVIEKAQVEITNLRMDSWTEQPPGAPLPDPTCTVNVKGANPIYTYGSDPSGAGATSAKPTAVGTYYVFATVPDALNWKGTSASASFEIVEQPKNIFEDHVDITLGAYEPVAGDPKELTNFPYRVVLSQDVPAGFDYTRAGSTGENVCFADKDGNVLSHYVEKWDPAGESVVYVRVPMTGDAEQKVVLYWKTADGKTAPAYDPDPVFSDWTKKKADEFGNKPPSEFGMVVVDGKTVDGWVDLPRMSETSWGVTTDPSETGHVVTNGSLRSGREVAYVIYDAATAEPLVPQQMPMAEGVYYVLFSAKVKTGEYVEPAPQRIDLRVIDRAPYRDLSDGMGTQTLGGRVLTANGDDGIEPKIGAEEGQGYWQVRTVKIGIRTFTYNPYWTHEDDQTVSSDYPYLLAGRSHKMHYIESEAKTNVLWRLTDVRFGNTFGTAQNMPETRCFLPWSATGYGISAYGNRTTKGQKSEVGQLVMMNLKDAAICSPCYTNGIGTVYFDTVNVETSDAGKDFMSLVLEVATETKDHLPPTDANAGEELENITEAEWKAVGMLPLRCRDGVFEPLAETNDLRLAIVKGGTDRNFYRVCAKLNQTGTLRFRLRRVRASGDGVGSEYGHFILVDNLLVSFPMSTAKAEPYGEFHPEKTGKQALGQEGAMANGAFPAFSDSEIFPRAKPVTNVVAGIAADPSTFIQLSKFHYQWHYLNQASNGWQSVDLRPDANFVATEKLEIPQEPGDVEFWLETYTKIPFFDYIDYSGAGLRLGGCYTEEVGMQYYPENALEGGRCFFRLREGKSEWNGIDVKLSGSGFGATTPMELIADHTWRGLVQVPTNVVGEVNFWFAGDERWEAGATEATETGLTWFPAEAVTNRLPARGTTSPAGGPKAFRADGASGYYEFQFNDENGFFTVGHAEYQTFNRWHDAKGDYFVGTYAETSGVNVAAMVSTNAQMKAWDVLRVTDPDWDAAFYLPNYEIDAFKKQVAYTKPVLMPNASWSGQNGMFVDAQLTGTADKERQQSSGIAWQMQGFGLGSVSYTEQDVPNGLDRVTFRARLAQAPTFDDFAYCYADGMMATNDYTFVIPAILSCNSKSGQADDFAPGASMSVIGYYTPDIGCYEFRVSRDDNANLRFSIYRWTRKGYRMTGELIGTHLFNAATFWHTSGTQKPDMYAMLISLGEDEAGKTTVIGGLTVNSAAPSSMYAGSGFKYRAIRCVDDSASRLTKGTVGVLSSSCNGRFLTARRHSKHLAASAIASFAKTPTADDLKRAPLTASWYDKDMYFAALPGSRSEVNDLAAMEKSWRCTSGRIELYQAPEYQYPNTALGFRPPADLGQTVDVYLKPTDSKSKDDDADWTMIASKVVDSYGWKDFSVVVRTNQSCHVMLKPGDVPADVVVGALPNGTSTVGGIRQYGWNGIDMPNPPDRDFMYTQAYVFDEITETPPATNRYCRLQPARAVATKPLSIRSPILEHGIGMIAFSYTNVHADAEIWVQLSTNDVVNHMTGTLGLNQSLREGTGPGEWETLRKYTYADLGAWGEQQFFVGVHDRTDRPVQGVFRVLVAPSVVSAAATRTLTDPSFGSIVITDVRVEDEPALDTSSWMGWNLRTLGDRADSERRMYLPDPETVVGKADSGLSAALNNSSTDGIRPGADPSEYEIVNPTIQSPTFRGKSIGYVKFRARVYDNSGVVGETAQVALYGAVDSGNDEWGEPITNFTVSASRYGQFEYRALDDERFSAIRLAIVGVKERAGDPARVLLDEVVVSEKTSSSVGFAYARPFRSDLNEDVPLAEAKVLGMDEQPLVNESWGIQAKLKLDQFDRDIDADRGFRVTFRYFKGDAPWGYRNWEKSAAASDEIELAQVGAKDDYVFRSTVAKPASVVPPTAAANTVVQYVVAVHYYLKGDPKERSSLIEVTETEGDGWTNPVWYAPIDKNAGKAEKVPYTILDGMSPGRAWINEVNYNDGTSAENGRVKVVTNQFIEIAVPWGVDMKGWKVVLTDMNLTNVTLATFGYNGLASKKQSGEHSGDYAFVVLQSPETQKAGGIRDAGGQAVADATWTSATLPSTLLSPGGQLQYSQPYQVELYRPSGILEHQFVVAGTNEWRLQPEYWKSFGYRYEGTNLLNDLDAVYPNPRRFFAGEDVSRAPDGKSLASFGVTAGAHGEEGGWSNAMTFTPGHLNVGQDPLTGWFLHPNGGSVWIYASVDAASRAAGNVRQRIGEDESQEAVIVVTSGSDTNVTYDVRPWFTANAVAVTETGRTNATFVGKGPGAKFNLNNVTETLYVVASEGIDPALLKAGLRPDDPYTPAVMRWLRDGSEGGTFKNPDGPITNAIYRGLEAGATNVLIGLKGMYVLDIDPTDPGWWLRAGSVEFGLKDRIRKSSDASGGIPYQNPQLGVKLYLSNDTDRAVAEVYAPKRLQGLGNERSDDPASYTSWTSVTFKVEAKLENGLEHNVGYLPFRWFVFGPDSFVKPEEAAALGRPPYTAKIELFDPFSAESPGYGYGWRPYRGNPIYLRWNITELQMLDGVEMLKADSTFDGSPLFK